MRKQSRLESAGRGWDGVGCRKARSGRGFEGIVGDVTQAFFFFS